MLYKIDDCNDINDFLVGILFYNYINEFDDEFLEEHDFSRKEIKEGIERLMIKYGYKNLLEIL